MNPRILKKLTRRADPIVRKLTKQHRIVVGYDDCESVETYQRVEEKYLDRWNGEPNKYGYFRQLKGTVGYGEMSGYYEPEWSDKDAYSWLSSYLLYRFTDWSKVDEDSGEYPMPDVDLSTPSAVFACAEKLRIS